MKKHLKDTALADSHFAPVAEPLQDFTARKNSKIPVLSIRNNIGTVSYAQPAPITTTDQRKYLIAANPNYPSGEICKIKSKGSIKKLQLSWTRTEFFLML